MVLNGFEPVQLAAEWSNRVSERMTEAGIPKQEVEETRVVLHAFVKTAAEELAKDPKVSVPYTPEILQLEASHAHLIIELFLRGVNQTAKSLRQSGKSWDERKRLLETLAWKLFNLSKLLVAFLYLPNPQMKSILSTPKDLQLMMKQSADVLVKQELTGNYNAPLPFNFPPGFR